MTVVSVAAAAVYLLLVTLAIIGVLLVVVPVSMAVGVLAAAGIGVGSLLQRSADREVPADDGAPADPIRGIPGVEPAWRHYLAVQARLDGTTAAGALLGRSARMWSGMGMLRERFDDLDDPIVRWAVGPLLAIPLAVSASVTAGAAVAAVAGGLVVGGAAGAAWVVRLGTVRLVRMIEIGRLWRSGAGATCTAPGCFGHTTTPVVECRCGRYHLALEPGAYGAIQRRCTCGSLIPSTITRAATTLRLRCPWCREPLLDGTMLDRNVRLAVIGAPGAGKSTVVESGLRDLGIALVGGGGRLDRLPVAVPGSGVTHCAASRIVRRGRTTSLHLFDATGADLDDGSVRARLPFLSGVHGLALVIDSVALPRLAPRATDGATVAAVDPEVTYRAVVTQLADDRVDLRRRSLAVLLHKADLLEASFRGRGPAPGSAGVRRWLVERGHVNLVHAIERDFGTVRYFLTSADGVGSASPATALAWTAAQAGLTIPDMGTPR